MLAVPPIVFARPDETEAIAILHLGRALCGHDGIIHGGLISTIFDESLARNVSHVMSYLTAIPNTLIVSHPD
jgi:hypothetical protein